MRHADNLTTRPDDLIFDNVSLSFGGKSVLHGLSFRVPAAERPLSSSWRHSC